MKKAEKIFAVENLAEEIKIAVSLVLVDYTGLSVKGQQELKKRLDNVGAKMTVVKNTLFRIAAQKAKIDPQITSDTVLTGPIALIITEGDPIAPLQVVYKFAKEFEIPSLKVGLVEGSFQDRFQLEKLAQLPSKDVILSQVLGQLGSPLYSIIGVLNTNMQKLISILSQKAKVLSA
jgi:large subunit ribosomal protein L10